jgi:hypothetical protein
VLGGALNRLRTDLPMPDTVAILRRDRMAQHQKLDVLLEDVRLDSWTNPSTCPKIKYSSSADVSTCSAAG